MATQKKQRVHLEIQTHRKNPIGILRSSVRKDGKVVHQTYGRRTGMTLEHLRLSGKTRIAAGACRAYWNGSRACEQRRGSWAVWSLTMPTLQTRGSKKS